MRVGDVGGLNEVYDENGELILREGESLIRRTDGDNLAIWKGRYALTSKTLLYRTKERGSIYITDSRLVFIRTPDPWLHFKTYGTPLELPEGVSGAAYAKGLRKMGLRVFAEIPYREVRSFKPHKKGKSMRLWLEDQDGTPIRAYFERRDRNDDKILVLEELLFKAGARKLS